ncbi:MAG: head GIN domain-containing protein [Fulvivirga sp.]|uniref:head GIN domain-containing protein n=1 Tax=Fulvivirga sp. TaxID=1931237 RepID=UPI0032EC4262
MKNYILSLIILSFSIGSFAQDVEERKLPSFDEVQVSQGIDAYLQKGTKESIKVEVKGIPLEEVLTEVFGDRLKVHLSRNRWRDYSVVVHITYVKLEEISASSAANVVGRNKIQSDRLILDVSSAADIEVDVDVNELTVDASSSGDVEVSGKTKYLEVDASSAGGVDAYDLEAEIVRVDVSSGADARVYATKEINAEASSGGSVRYRGNPGKSRSDTSSGGSVRKSN